MSAPAEAPLRPRLMLVLALALVGLAYARVPEGGFAWDDHPLIEQQQAVRELLPLPAYFTRLFWADPLELQVRSFYRPLTTLSYALDYRLGGGRPGLFHLTNLLLHLLACALVYALARRADAGPPSAALAAALFGTLPRLTESVAWISGRTDLLAAVGALACLALYARETGPARVGAGLALLAGLLSKEVAAAALPAVAAYELARTPRPTLRAALARAWPLLAAAGLYGALRLLALAAGPPALPAADAVRLYALPAAWRPVFALQALGSYALMLLDPLRPRLQGGVIGLLSPVSLAAGALALLGLVGLGVRVARRPPGPLPSALGALALFALLPVLHLVPAAIKEVASDRYLYLPAAAAAAALPGRWARPPRWAAGLALAVLLAFGVATHLRSLDWLDELRLWRVEAERSPESSLAAASLANLYLDRDRLPEALTQYRRAAALELAEAPRRVGAAGAPVSGYLANAALAEQRLGHHAEAERLLGEAAAAFPGKLRYRYNLALAQARALDFDRAEATLRAAPPLEADDHTRRELLALLARARAARAALPPERPDEPLATTTARAAADEELGRPAEAAAGWARVLASPEATPSQVEHAGGFLVLHAPRPAAEQALSTLARRGLPRDRLEALAQLLEERFAE